MITFKSKKVGNLIVIVLIGLILLTFSATLAEKTEAFKITIQTPPTVGALPIIWMIESGVLAKEYDIDLKISPDHQRGLALLSNADIDMLVTGVNVGAKAFNRGINLKLVNTNIWGIDYLLTNDFKADSWSDLIGKTISLPLKGGPLDFLVCYFLHKNDVDPEGVEFVYTPSNNGAKIFQLGRVDSIVLPEPLVTIALSNYEKAYLSFDLQQEWAKLHNGDDRIPFVGLFVREDIAVEKQQMVTKFNEYYQKGVDWVHNNPGTAAELAASYLDQSASIVQASLSRINLNYYPQSEEIRLLELFFREIMEMYPEMIGGKVPDESFYF